MIYSIFYSWQSDLPNKDNRSYIESCIKRAVKLNEKNVNMNVFFEYDRDTRGVTGAPDIGETIFNKIEKADVFICDVSIINSSYEGRKTCNPNVLIELGYAAKTLGWEKVICLFNTKYGNISDLPFDLNHKRICLYNSDEEGNKAILSKRIVTAIGEIYGSGLLFNPIKDYMKSKIDYCLLEICKQLCCLVFGTITMTDALNSVNRLLECNTENIREYLQTDEGILGFFTKNTLINVKILLEELFIKLTTSSLFSTEWTVTVLEAIQWLQQYQWLISDRATNKLYRMIYSPNTLFKVVSGTELNKTNPNGSQLLLKKVGVNQGQVLYCATMPTYNEKLLLSPHRVNSEALEGFVECVISAIHLVSTWLKKTGGEFILDTDYYKINQV